MAVLGEKHRELTRTQRIIGLGHVVEELDVLLGIELALRHPEVLALAPAEGLLLAGDEYLNVDIFVVHLELGVGFLLELTLHHVDIDVLAVEFVDARLHRRPVRRSDQFESLFHARVDIFVQRAVFQRV